MGKIIHNGIQITREINTNNILFATTYATQTTSSTDPEKIPMNGFAVVGTKLSKTTDGGIKIGSGVSYVKVSGSIIFSTISGTDNRHHILIYKNSTNMGSLVFRLRGNWDSINIQPLLISVTAGDVIYLYMRSQDASGAVINSASLMVEAVQ